MCLTGEQRQGGGKCVCVCGGAKSECAILSYFLTVAAPDLLDPKSATHNTKPRLSFSTKPVTLTPREESEVREVHILVYPPPPTLCLFYTVVGEPQFCVVMAH